MQLRKPDSISKKDIIIEDPKMEPFFITKSTNGGGFTVYQRVTKGNNNTEYIDTISYPSNFTSALRTISKCLLDVGKQKKYSSVKEYLDRWEEIKNKMEEIVDLD